MAYGYFISMYYPVPDATTVSLFDASNMLVGRLSFDGMPDPEFVGGFVGIGSDVPFVRAEVMFFPQAFNFVFDNLQFSDEPVSTIPEPASLTLVGLGALAIAARLRTRCARSAPLASAA
jgi:hypothetical protein